ncbi:MAG: DUF1614 domain-containing protein [Deltaproteobacteria bacterium]|nr:DUF1614 domain-containing protein [Deltaproteobacteria bacterium]
MPQRSPVLALLGLVLGLTAAFLALDLIEYAYARIGIAPGWIVALLAASLLGSPINLPLGRMRGGDAVLAVNLGGGVIPTGLSLYLLLTHAPTGAALAGVLIVALAVHRLARPVPGVGIAVPLLAPPLIAAAAALLLAPDTAPSVAYIAGTLGTLIGADLANLRRLASLGGPVASIGGAGTFDGIFVTGILAVLLA